LIALNLLISVADIASLAMLVYIVNFYAQASTGNALAWLPLGLGNRNSTGLILVFLLVFSLKNYAGYLINRAQCKFMARVASRISQNNLLNYLEGNYSDYINEDSARYLRKISFQPLEFCQHILDGVQQIITQCALILLTIIAIVFFNAQLFLLLFIILLPPVIIVFYFIKRRLRSVRSQTRASSERSLQHLQEALAGYIESNIYDKNTWFLERYITWQQQYNRHLADYLVVQGTPGRVIEIFALLGLFILISIGNGATTATTSSVVTLGAFLAAAYKIIPGIVKILNISGQMNAYAFTLKDLEEPGKTQSEKAVQQTDPVQRIQLNNVGFRYNGQTVLNNFNLQVDAGTLVGISGASGKGKTTLLNLLLGFLDPHSGEILINGSAADIQTRQQYRKYIAYVKQQTFLVHDTILRNIVLDEKIVDEQKLANAIRLSGLDELIKNYPEKLDKVITENGKNISGGQRQRIALARAFYKDATTIILDEPFNELDEQSECTILTHLKQFAASGRLIILITHHSKSLAFCNKTISLDE
jgi:ABC-type multidrug transport system fused ATPase/permease subunit